MESKEQGVSSKEAEKQPPILLVYRDNDLFQKYMPVIAETLKSLGRQVEIQNFPKEATEDDIKKWGIEHKAEIGSKVVWPDGTSYWPLSNAEIKGLKEKNRSLSYKLDNIFDEATLRALFGENYISKWRSGGREVEYSDEDHYNGSKQVILGIVERILVKKENVPKKVYIFTDRILDHMYWALSIKFKKEIGEEEKNAKSEEEKDLYYKKWDDWKNDSQNLSSAAEEFKEWLTQAGIKAEHIEIKELATFLKEKQQLDKSGNWIVVDRHSKLTDKYTFRSAKQFLLPESNFYKSAEDQKMIDVSDQELTSALKEIIIKDFGSKEQ